jgi:epoxyqueuosine reductase
LLFIGRYKNSVKAMNQFQIFDKTLLDGAGLNWQAVFNIDALPAEIAAPLQAHCTSIRSPRQLILIGHAGRKLWESVKVAGIDSENPIDDFTIQTVRRWFAECQAQNTYEILYPGTHPIGLQRLGQLAGWHHATPFMVGIDQEWGTWYAYRAVVLADTEFEPTKRIESESPCNTCQHKACIASCPASALDGEQFDLGKCVAYRKQAGSSCKATCQARISCPVGSIHRYSDEQIHHTYSNSMRAIERYY